MPAFDALPPLALYIHIPWCVRKCPYCDFNSHEARGAIPEADYAAALVADLEQALPNVWGRRIETVFFGGGTPSLFSPDTVDTMLCAVRACLPLAIDAEITLEANPGTVDVQRFRGFRAAGVNRLSLGIQSFAAHHLKALGRIHDAREARAAVDAALATFDNVNLDLMYALPHQSLDEARADIAAAIACGTPHVSAYHLTIEPNTLFHRHPPPVPDDDSASAMQDAIEESLATAGYAHYETSAYARSGKACRHNLNYWTFGDYLGLGAGAHGKISFKNNILRETRPRQPKAYLARAETGAAFAESRAVAPDEIGFEFMMNALRLRDGFPTALFAQRTGLPLTHVLRELEAAEARGFVERDHARVRPTVLGQRYLNDLLQIFLRDDAAAARPRESV